MQELIQINVLAELFSSKLAPDATLEVVKLLDRLNAANCDAGFAVVGAC